MTATSAHFEFGCAPGDDASRAFRQFVRDSYRAFAQASALGHAQHAHAHAHAQAQSGAHGDRGWDKGWWTQGRGWGPGAGKGAGGGWPFGPDFPWGGGQRGRGGWPFDATRARASRGDVRLAILALLQESPRHGYQLIQDIGERSHGAWNPSPGSVYPALSSLQDEGLIDDEKVDGKRVFSLTESGRRYVEQRAEDLARVFADNRPGPEHEDITDLRELIWGVGGAAVTVIGSGTPEQRERAREILARTRRELYRLLSEDDEEQ